MKKSHILEGSQAISNIINNIKPDVVAAYPITPQTHIVEDLAKLKADGKAEYEYLRAESEFAAASIILGASAAGSRVYSATSSQGLLLMAEVLFNIAGMRLPVVITVVNRAVSAPINIWNDHQDAMAARDAGWIQLFAEDHQEAVEQHILAYKIAEKLKLPVMVNIDGFVLTHTYDEAIIPSQKEIIKFLPAYKPVKGEYLDVKNPVTLGAFASPEYYMEIRQQLYNDLVNSQKTIKEEYDNLKKIIPSTVKKKEENSKLSNGLIEYYGAKNPEIILIAMGSMVGTIKDVVDEVNNLTPSLSLSRRGGNSLFSCPAGREQRGEGGGGDFTSPEQVPPRGGITGGVGVLKIKSFRPFPSEEINKIISKVKYVAVIEKAISLGSVGPLMLEVKNSINNEVPLQGGIKGGVKIQNFIIGLGGRDVTKSMVEKIIGEVQKNKNELRFIGKG